MHKENKKNPLLVILGPTATGKTKLSVALAKRFNAEIISADSMQIYKGMDIGTAKVSEEEKSNIPHHLVDFLDIDEKFSVAKYTEMAKDCISEIHAKNKLPILVGGTGLYIDSLINNISFAPGTEDENYREELYNIAGEHGNQYLLDKLKEVDPLYAETLHSNNLGRIIRVLEMYKVSGKNYTENLKLSKREEPLYETMIIGLDYRDRAKLYENINKRVDKMFEAGIIEEAKAVLWENSSNTTALQAIGYKELIPYINGEASLEEVSENLKMQTRRYAKRQKTWFRKNNKINWIYLDDYDNFDEIINFTINLVENWKAI